MTLNYVALTLDLYDGQGNPVITGEALFTPSAQLADTTNHELTIQAAVPAVFHAGGFPQVRLLATDNTAPTPSGWGWTVSFTGMPGSPAGFSFFLPAAPFSFTATHATPAVFTASGSSYADDDAVTLSGGSLPGGFTSGTTYYVVSASGTAFSLAATAGGAAISSSSSGSGTVQTSQAYLSSLAPVGSVAPAGGGTITGPLVISATPSGSAAGLPVGEPGGSAASNGLQVVSSYPSDDISDGTDGTGRLLLYSYQRANTNSFGETIRNFLMRYDAKAMTAWYGPVDLYDGSGDPVTTDGWHPWAWAGAHYEANDHGSIHAHYEIEVPDSTGALQGRIEIPFGNQTTGVIGLDKTNIKTNLADFNVRCYGTDHTGTGQQQEFRLSAPAGWEKPISFSNDSDGASASERWKIRATSETESGSNAGTNFQLARYDDSGTLLDTPLQVSRQTGGITLGSTSATAGVTILRDGGVALTITQSGASAGGIQVVGADTSSIAYETEVSGDSNNRLQIQTTGQLNWGPGSAGVDTNLYRSTTGVLKTDNTFHVGTTLRLNTTSLAGGVGVFAIANAGTPPSGSPSAGGVLYVQSGALKYVGSSGTVTTIASA